MTAKKVKVKVKKKKIKFKNILFTVLFLAFFILLFAYILNLPVKNIYISGNSILSDKEIISLSAKKAGLSEEYVEMTDEKKKSVSYENNNDDRLFIAETKVIEKLAKKESCVIVGRCADYILKDNKDTIKVFLYSDDESKVNRAVKYYGLDKKNALKQIKKINKERQKHYKFYTNREWTNQNNYDLSINVDKYGVEKTADIICDFIK